jgi:hypothetical protein
MRPQNRESILAAKLLMVLGASIIFTLGVVHLVYTFWGPKLTSRARLTLPDLATENREFTWVDTPDLKYSRDAKISVYSP